MKKLNLLLATLVIIPGCRYWGSQSAREKPVVSRELKPEDLCGLYLHVANPSEYLVLREDGTFELREVQEVGDEAVRRFGRGLPWIRTLAGSWRIAEGDTLIPERIRTVSLTRMPGFPPGGYAVLRGAIETEEDRVIIKGLRPPLYPGTQGETLWVRRKLPASAREKPRARAQKDKTLLPFGEGDGVRRVREVHGFAFLSSCATLRYRQPAPEWGNSLSSQQKDSAFAQHWSG